MRNGRWILLRGCRRPLIQADHLTPSDVRSMTQGRLIAFIKGPINAMGSDATRGAAAR
jgi:hypothetical protein